MKFSQYNIIVEKNYEIILYNSKNSKIIKLKNKNEIINFKNLVNNINAQNKLTKILYDNGFIVNKDCDEFLETKKIIDEYFYSCKSKFYLMIYVTEHCNFRCIYCPQKHSPKILTEDNWNNIYKFIENQVKNDTLKELNISFFGGEPLLEIKKIFSFLEKLKKLQKKYPNIILRHEMTTNGYLLSPKTFNILEKYNLEVFQITIDGFAEAHDKFRPRANGGKTWYKIIKNLEYIHTKNTNTKIIIRMNYNNVNKNSIEPFMKYLNEKFYKKNFITVINPITAFSNHVNNELVDHSDFSEELDLHKLTKNNKKDLNILKKFSLVCKSAYINNYTITSSGHVTKCEQAYDDYSCIIGKLDKDEGILFYDNLQDWNNNFEINECKKCVIYPLCAARKCPARKFNNKDSNCILLKDDITKNIINYIKMFAFE